MKAIALTHIGAQAGTRIRPARQNGFMTRRHALAKIQAVGALAGLAGGVLSGLTGSLLIAAGWLAAGKDVQQWLSSAGSVLLLLTIPLIVLGACCLDCLEKEGPKRSSKVARYYDDEQ